MIKSINIFAKYDSMARSAVSSGHAVTVPIRSAVFQEIQHAIPSELRNIPGICRLTPLVLVGIYFLVRNGQLIYIGKSTNVLGRVGKSHEKYRLGDEVFFLPIDEQCLFIAEAALISAIRPILNGRMFKNLPFPEWAPILDAIMKCSLPDYLERKAPRDEHQS